MDEGSETQTDARRRQSLLKRVDQMVSSGRLTEQEAARLRAADGPGEFDQAIRDIRARHAGTSLKVAVDEGRLSQEEANGLLHRVRKGEHSRSIRAQVRRLRRSAGSSARVPDLAAPEGEPQEDPRA